MMYKGKKSNQPLVSVVTVNKNSAERILHLVESVKRLSYSNIELIVVDNGSQTEDLNILHHNRGDFLLIENHHTNTYAQAVNTSIRFSKGKYIFFVGNDMVLTPGCLEPLVDSLEGNQAIGAVSPKVKMFEQPDLIYYAGYTEMHKITLENKIIGYRQNDRAEFEKASFTSYPYSRAMMLPRSVIDKTCLMPEVYELFFECFDWVTQIKKAGYNIYFQPRSILYKQTSTDDISSPARTYYFTRSRMLYTLRNRSGVNLIAGMLYHILTLVPRMAFKLSTKKKISYVKAYANGLFWALKHVFDRKLYYNQLS